MPLTNYLHDLQRQERRERRWQMVRHFGGVLCHLVVLLLVAALCYCAGQCTLYFIHNHDVPLDSYPSRAREILCPKN